MSLLVTARRAGDGDVASTALPGRDCRSVDIAAARLDDLPSGGRTPLADSLKFFRYGRDLLPGGWGINAGLLNTDGGRNVASGNGEPGQMSCSGADERCVADFVMFIIDFTCPLRHPHRGRSCSWGAHRLKHKRHSRIFRFDLLIGNGSIFRPMHKGCPRWP